METEFGWSFVYLGSDLSDVHDADTLGIKTRGVSTKGMMGSNYDVINSTVNLFRGASGTTEMKYAVMDEALSASVETLNANYETSTGIKIN